MLQTKPSGFIMQLHKVVIAPAKRFRAKARHASGAKAAGRFAMVKRTSFEVDGCPIARSLDAIGDWWSMLIIRDALLGARRFGEFQKSLGLAKNILTVRLRTLVDQGILKMAPASDGSAYQEYVLTPKGRGIFPILVALRQWSEEFDQRPDEIATILADRRKGRPVRKLELYSQDGRLLTAADTALRPRPGSKASKAVRRIEA